MVKVSSPLRNKIRKVVFNSHINLRLRIVMWTQMCLNRALTMSTECSGIFQLQILRPKFSSLGGFGPSDQNEQYHTPLISKIWDLVDC